MPICLACEICLTRPGEAWDSYAERVVCRVCIPDWPPNSYDCQFVGNIPYDLPETYPPRPTVEVA